MTAPIPDAAIEQHIAILGKTGSGKTYAAKSVVEGLLRHRRRVCIIDPTGAWWGLRFGADGRSPGFPILILGGKHGDLPLPALGGAAVARLIAEQGASVVCDTSQLLVGERSRWFTDFAREVFRLNEHPLHLVIDEVHNFAPQGKVPDPETGKMLHAANSLFSGGRSRGFRLLAITQRPAKFHKDSLTCVDTLVSMRMLAPQDREAVKDWIDGCGDATTGKEVLGSLANLSRGEGWVWYPEGSYLKRCAFPAITTFDSSATPTGNAPHALPKHAAEINLDEIRNVMAEAVSEAEANDPKRLRAKVLELEREIKAHKSQPAELDQRAVDAIRAQARIEAATGLASIINGRANLIRDMGDDIVATIKAKFAEHERFLREVVQKTVQAIKANSPAPATAARPEAPMPRAIAPARREVKAPAVGVTSAQQRVLDAAAFLHSIGHREPDARAVGMLAGIDPTGGYFSNTVGPLSAGGLIVRSNGTITLTDAGHAAANQPDSTATLDNYHAALRECLKRKSEASARIFDAIVKHGHREITSVVLGETVGIDSTGGYFSNSIGPLSTLGLIERRNGVVRPTSIMFPEGL